MFQHLPTEIAYIIFELCPRNDLTLVCRTWYITTQALSHLWSTIFIHKIEQFEDAPIFKRIVELARDIPIDLNVRLPSNEVASNHVRDITKDIATVLGWVLARLCTLRIEGQEENHIAEFIFHTVVCLPEQASLLSLQRVALTGGVVIDRSERDLDGVLPSFFALTPDLHTLTLPCYIDSLPIRTRAINLSALRTLELDTRFTNDVEHQASSAEVLTLLSQIPTIVSISYITPDEWSASPGSEWFSARLAGESGFASPIGEHALPIVLPHLKHITISAPGGNSLDILRCIRAPLLKTITLEGVRKRFPRIDSEWADLVRNEIFVTLITLAERSPAVKAFRAHRCPMDEATFRALFFGGSSIRTPFYPFPALEYLALEHCGTGDEAMPETPMDDPADVIGRPRPTLKALVLSSMRKAVGHRLATWVYVIAQGRPKDQRLWVDIFNCLLEEEDIKMIRQGGATGEATEIELSNVQGAQANVAVL